MRGPRAHRGDLGKLEKASPRKSRARQDGGGGEGVWGGGD